MNYFQLICNNIFLSNCRKPKANKQSTILSTRFRPGSKLLCEDSTTNSYAKEMRNLVRKQEVAAISFLKTLHPLIDKEGLLRVG